jgi:nucleotide-binding universal stress UspA family protein
MEQATPQALRRILVPLDGSFFSEQALRHAQAIGGSETELILLSVVPPAEEIRGLLGNVLVTAQEVRHAYEEGTRKDLERAQKAWLGDRPHVRLEVAEGDPSEEILRATERDGVDLIVMATHGRGALGRWAIGSVADRVARTSPVPVMLIRPVEEIPTAPGPATIERLIVPLDGSETAMRALPFAAVLALHLRIPVLVVTVADLPPDLSGPLIYAAAYSEEVYNELVETSQNRAREVLAAGAATLRAAGVTVSEQILEGPVAAAIAGAAGRHDVIVMTSHGRSGFKRWVLGSVTSKLIHQRDIPVVLVPSAPHRDEAATERSS